MRNDFSPNASQMEHKPELKMWIFQEDILDEHAAIVSPVAGCGFYCDLRGFVI